MRILFAIHTWHPEGRGGSEHHARELAQALQEKGHQIGVFTRTGRPDLDRYQVVTGWDGDISVTRINNLYWETPTFEWIYKNEKVHEAFLREVDSFQPDLVHVHHLTGLSTTIIEALKARGLPVVFTLHDFWTICPRGQRMTRDLELCVEVDRNRCYTCLGGLWPHLFPDRGGERTIVDLRGELSPANLAEFDRHMNYVLGLCDLLVCPTEFHRERMLDFPLDPERIISLPHGMKTSGFSRTKRPGRRPRTIGYLGAVIPVKGVHVLIEAFKKLDRPDLVLAIHGECQAFHDDQTYKERLEAQAGGRKNIVFAGAYEPEDVPRLLEGIDILVVPSLWWETFCITLREGLLAGIPVVASDLGAMREALDGEENGLLFRTGDANDLARVLARLLEDEDLYRRYKDRGFTVKTLEEYIPEIERVYDQAVEAARARAATLKVAPPSFPREPEALPAPARGPSSLVVPWEELGVAVKHHGALDMSFVTQRPTAEKPVLGLDITLRDGDMKLGQVGVLVDMRALAGNAEDTGRSGRASRGEDSTLEADVAEEGGEGNVERAEEDGQRLRRIQLSRDGRRLVKIGLPRRKKAVDRLSLAKPVDES